MQMSTNVVVGLMSTCRLKDKPAKETTLSQEKRDHFS